MPKDGRTTKNAFGQKFLRVMKDKGLAHDFAAVAAAFGVKVPSVYDWVDHGRFAKSRFADLVAWSGRSLDWWFDIPVTHQVAEHPNVGSPFVAPPPGLNTSQRDVLQAYARLPASRQKAVREELMREAAQFMDDVLEFQRREGVKSVVSPARAAQALPPRPDGEQPETTPGKLD